MFNPTDPAPEYALRWPRELFRAELRDVLEQLGPGKHRDGLELLFAESLAGPDPLEDLAELPRILDSNPWTSTIGTPQPTDLVIEFGRQILAAVDALPVYQRPRYYLERNTMQPAPQRPGSGGEPFSLPLQESWATIVAELFEAGYLDRRIGDACNDGTDDQQIENLNKIIADRTYLTDQWPLDLDKAGPYAPEHFFTLVEVFHDLVARPRTRTWHGYDQHYWFHDFSERTGQAVYRWKVNDLLESHWIDLELADTGEDRGRLVARKSDPRQDLVHTAPTGAAVDRNQDRVQHAIALYRKRNATRDDKRRACRKLADVLERRRKAVLEKQLAKKDEGDLFNIMNNFAIRHHRDDQQPDYDPVFLDWIFWSFLASVELSNRLIDRADSQAEQANAS